MKTCHPSIKKTPIPSKLHSWKRCVSAQVTTYRVWLCLDASICHQECRESSGKSMCRWVRCDLCEVGYVSACVEGAFSLLCIWVVDGTLVSSLNNILLLFPEATYINWKINVIHTWKTTISMYALQDKPWEIRSFICRVGGRTLLRKTFWSVSCCSYVPWEFSSRLHTLPSWWQTCIFQQHWLRVLDLPVGYAIWSYLTFEYISIFSYSFTCLASKVMLGSAESIISRAHGAESSPGEVLHHPRSQPGSCYSQQRRAQAEQNGRLAQVFGQSFRRISVISRVQREQALSWPAGMGEDGERQRSWWDVRGEQTQFRLVISGLLLNIYSQSPSVLTREISWG